MKSTTLLAFAATLLSTTTAINLQRRSEGSSRVVSLSTQRRAVANPVERDRLRRRGSVQADLDNEETLYFVNATVGTPAQTLRLHIDTGSSDLWVNTPSSKLCLQKTQPCSFAGTYSANSSSTYDYVGSYFNISYVDGSGASGDYVSDTITIGNTTLDRLQFGVGYTSSSAQGILGIGYELNEVQVGRAGLDPYQNLPSQMKSDGLIQSNAYSLWLNDLDANTGSILFGGVDTAQFKGELATLPIQQSSGVYAEFLITLTSLSLGGTVIADNLAQAVLLDSGSSLTYLPDSIVETIYTELDAQYDSSSGVAYIPCNIENQNTSLAFSFSGVEITVGMDELALDLVTASGRRPTFQDGTTACLFGIAPAGEGTNVLGDTFLRSAYVVYDMDNNEISIAQTNFNATASNVLEITTGDNAVPSATAVTDSVAATAGVVTTNSAGGLGVQNAAPSVGAAGSTLIGAAAFIAGLFVLY